MNIFGFFLLCLFFIDLVCFSTINGQSSSTDAYASTDEDIDPTDPLKGHRLVCLYNQKQFYKLNHRVSSIDPEICTHLNYEFAQLDEKTYLMKPGDTHVDIDEGMYKAAVALKDRNPKLKVMLSLGGWQDSTAKYSKLVESGERVDNFVEKAVDFLKDNHFDGLDVAWEYPNCWQGALGVAPKDKKNFPEFLEKLRKRFDKENLLLSISVGSVRREIDGAYDGPPISHSVHHVNVMTYDMHGPWEDNTGHHTQMEALQGDTDPYLNAKAVMEKYVQIGIDKKKLNLGVATYAKTFTLKDPSKHGLHAPAKGAGKPGSISKQGGYLCYSEICQYLNAGNWTEDEEKKVGMYAYSGDQWACYDPPMMVVRKAKWVVENGYGGLLVKDLSCDDVEGKCYSMPYPLTKMMRMEMIHKLKS